MRTILTAMTVGALILAGSSVHAASNRIASCKEAKAKTAGKKAFDLLKAFGKNVKKPDVARLAAGISKAESKFIKGFSKAESRPPCQTTGDAAAIEAKVDALVADLVGSITDPCCAANPAAIAFATLDPGPTPPKCGAISSFRCGQPGTCAGDPGIQCVLDADCPVADRPCEGEGDPNFITNMCSPTGPADQCDFGPCFITPPVCAGATAIGCSQDSDCVGTCIERTPEGFPIDLDCGGLYTGGGLNSVPLPLVPPDRGVGVQAVTECEDGILTLGPITQNEIGPNYGPDGQGLNCTQGKKCDPGISPDPGGLDGNGLCAIEDDCGCVFGSGCCVERCLFGPPLPIPNAVTAPTSVCVRNVIAKDTSGTVDCRTGGADMTIPIASVIHVTGDLLNKSEGRDVPGIQTCPLCSRVCIGGTKTAGFPCEDDSDCDSNNCSSSEECIAGPRDGLPCTPQTSRLAVHKCCFNGNNNLQACETDADCAPPPGPAPRCELSFDACTDDSDCTVIPGDSCIKCVPGCTSYPTSHDCPPDPAADITFRIGGLPIDFSLTDQFNELEASDLSANGRRAFCGFCRDVNGAGTLCFEGNLDPGCPVAIPPADGNGVPCTSDADCASDRCLDGVNRNLICSDDSDCPGSTCVADTDEYESCAQRNPGAFSNAGATTFWSQGSTEGQWLSDNQCHDATLVGIFCIPPTFDATIDNAGDLPGPGMSNLMGRQRLAADAADLDPGITGAGLCSPSASFLDLTSAVLD